jgi:hypothetical protein
MILNDCVNARLLTVEDTTRCDEGKEFLPLDTVRARVIDLAIETDQFVDPISTLIWFAMIWLRKDFQENVDEFRESDAFRPPPTPLI